LNSFLADFGGLLGLWIGASVISMFELLALLYYASQAYVRKRKSSMGSLARQNIIQPPPKKISLGSSIYRPRNTTPSTIKSRISLLVDDTDQMPLKMEASGDDSSSGSSSKRSTAASKLSFPYWPPGQDLPCTCKLIRKFNQLRIQAYTTQMVI
jgi:hypothetical protein